MLLSIGKFRLLRVKERMDHNKSCIIVFANKLVCLSVQSVRGDTWLVRDTHSRKKLCGLLLMCAFCTWILMNNLWATRTRPQRAGFLGIL